MVKGKGEFHLKKQVAGTLVLLAALLAGCGKSADQTDETASSKQPKTEVKDNQSSKSSAQAESSSSAANSSSAKESSSASQTQAMWNPSKAQQLKQFMGRFSQKMNQQYQAYQPGNNVNFYGLQIPDDVLNHKNGSQASIGERPINVKWSTNGQAGDGVYSLVAVYSDAKDQSYGNQHVYFFTIVDGKPQVLITMQNQGMPHNYLHFSETKNQELRQEFAQLVSEKDM